MLFISLKIIIKAIFMKILDLKVIIENLINNLIVKPDLQE